MEALRRSRKIIECIVETINKSEVSDWVFYPFGMYHRPSKLCISVWGRPDNDMGYAFIEYSLINSSPLHFMSVSREDAEIIRESVDNLHIRGLSNILGNDKH